MQFRTPIRKKNPPIFPCYCILYIATLATPAYPTQLYHNLPWATSLYLGIMYPASPYHTLSHRTVPNSTSPYSAWPHPTIPQQWVVITSFICSFPVGVATLDFAVFCSCGVSWRHLEVWIPEEGRKGCGVFVGDVSCEPLLEIFKCIFSNMRWRVWGWREGRKRRGHTYLKSSSLYQYRCYLHFKMFFFLFLLSDHHPRDIVQDVNNPQPRCYA